MAQLNPVAAARAAESARTSYGRLLAILAAATGDIPAAEDALADAFERALTAWERDGVPTNPEAWLLTVARNRQRDRFRSASYRTSSPLDDSADATTGGDADFDAIPDKRLELLFVCAHPAIEPGARAPMMLQTVLGFPAARIAQAFAVPGATMAQRLVRAKQRISGAGIPFVVPNRDEMAARLPAVLEAVYGTYAIDWQGSAGAIERQSLDGEALYLAETLAELLPDEPEVLGLAALVCLSLARSSARLDGDGHLIPLPLQNTALWDVSFIARGERYLKRARRHGKTGRFQLEAAAQAVHDNRRVTGITDWLALRSLYTGLLQIAPTLGAAVSLATVTGEIDGPRAALAALDALPTPAAERFQPAWAARAHFLRQIGATDEAAHAFEKAISLTTDAASRAYLQKQARTEGVQ